MHLLVFYDNNDVSRLIIEMYTYTHSSEKMVIFASFFALPTMATFCPSPPLCVNKNQSACTRSSLNRPAARAENRPSSPATRSVCHLLLWFLSSDRAIFESRSSFRSTSAFNLDAQNTEAHSPLTTRRRRHKLTFLFLYAYTTRKRRTKNERY